MITFTCSICNKPIEPEPDGWAHGHNAEPVAEGRCCRHCNDTVVIPTRIVAIYRRRLEEAAPDMLKALKACGLMLAVDSEAYALVNAAIAKAEGT